MNTLRSELAALGRMLAHALRRAGDNPVARRLALTVAREVARELRAGGWN